LFEKFNFKNKVAHYLFVKKYKKILLEAIAIKNKNYSM
jgi:hypothetical protein